MLSRCFHFGVFEIFVSSLFLLVLFAFWECWYSALYNSEADSQEKYHHSAVLLFSDTILSVAKRMILTFTAYTNISILLFPHLSTSKITLKTHQADRNNDTKHCLLQCQKQHLGSSLVAFRMPKRYFSAHQNRHLNRSKNTNRWATSIYTQYDF